MKRLRLFVCLLILAPLARAATLERDLGDGLIYLRAVTLPADLALETKAPACVLDLRYATAGGDITKALDAWLNLHTTEKRQVYVLINGDTARGILSALARLPEHPGLLTLGPALSDFAPDIAIATNPKEERSAYDAFAQSKDPTALLTPPSDKARYDEAAMVKAMHDGEPLPEAEPVPDLEEVKEQPAAPPPLIDHALRRAVQIHRAWLALAAP